MNLLRITNGMDENGLTVYASRESRDAASDVMEREHLIPGFVEENEGFRLDREGYDRLLVFAYSGQYVHALDLDSGRYLLLAHDENEPSATFDTFDDLMADAITRIAKPR
jgi:hypothetical protein